MPPDVLINTNQTPLVGPQDNNIVEWTGNLFQLFLDSLPTIYSFVGDVIGFIIGMSFPLSLVFLIVIIYSVERLKEIRKKEAQKYDLKVEPAYEQVDEEGNKGDETLAKRWQVVAEHIESQNQNDWKQAIIDADIMLDDVLTKLGYQGDGVGEKLKRAEPADFGSLNDAWEAHKVRNMIAHEGSNFQINQVDAKRVIQLYRKVFEEFYYL